LSKKNASLNRYLEVCRRRRVPIFVCKPHIYWLDKKVTEDKGHLWLHVPKRSFAEVRFPSRLAFEGDVSLSTSPPRTVWRKLFTFRFPDPTGHPDWEKYLVEKDDHMARFADEIAPASGGKSRK
jgi:hypothetical protein